MSNNTKKKTQSQQCTCQKTRRPSLFSVHVKEHEQKDPVIAMRRNTIEQFECDKIKAARFTEVLLRYKIQSYEAAKLSM
jgi:hypothetical protein